MSEMGSNVIDFNVAAERIRLEKVKKELELEKLKMELERINTEMDSVNMIFATTGSQDSLNKLQALLGESIDVRNKIVDLENSLGIVHTEEDHMIFR